MSDLYVNTGYKETQLAPFGPIGIIAHTSNKEFVKQVSEVLSRESSMLRDPEIFMPIIPAMPEKIT